MSFKYLSSKKISAATIIALLTISLITISSPALSQSDQEQEQQDNQQQSSETAQCPVSLGFWKNHSDSWPVSELTLGDESYSAEELIEILKMPPRGDASIILAKQLIAAKLNVANAVASSPIDSTINDADSLLASFENRLPYKVKANSEEGNAMVNDAEMLDDYNNGKSIQGCENQSDIDGRDGDNAKVEGQGKGKAKGKGLGMGKGKGNLSVIEKVSNSASHGKVSKVIAVMKIPLQSTDSSDSKSFGSAHLFLKKFGNEPSKFRAVINVLVNDKVEYMSACLNGEPIGNSSLRIVGQSDIRVGHLRQSLTGIELVMSGTTVDIVEGANCSDNIILTGSIE